MSSLQAQNAVAVKIVIIKCFLKNILFMVVCVANLELCCKVTGFCCVMQKNNYYSLFIKK